MTEIAIFYVEGPLSERSSFEISVPFFFFSVVVWLFALLHLCPSRSVACVTDIRAV